MSVDPRLLDKLAKLEALFAGASTAGEKTAAGAAIDRLRAKSGVRTDRYGEPEAEMKFSMPDAWSVHIFIALCRKRGIRPYRYPRQRHTTIMVRVRPMEFQDTVMQEFTTLHQELVIYIDEMVDHLITKSMKSDGREDDL